jgi:RNA recognition motif-containing protein
MEPKLYVGNMSYDTSEQDLRTLFSEAGSVDSIDIIMDRYSGQPKGFAFVTMGSQAEAEKAVSLFDTREMKGRALKVNLARPREERPSSGGYRSRR